MKRKITVVLAVLMFLSFSISSAAAFIPPGLAKKGGLPPGIQKRFSQKDWQKDWEDIIKEWGKQDWEKVFEECREKFGKEMIEREYDTTLEKINVSNRRIVIQEGTAYLNLLVADNAEIKLDGKSARLNSLSVGDKVNLELNKDNTVTKIIGLSKGEDEEDSRTIKGANVESINYETRRMILNYNNTRASYVANDNATITVNGVRKNLNYIKTNMKVDVTIEEGRISRITVVDRVGEYNGKLIDKYTNDKGAYILIEIDDKPVLFYIDEDLNIPSRLIDEDVYIEVEDDIVVDIWKK